VHCQRGRAFVQAVSFIHQAFSNTLCPAMATS
jgi:hypothetical protein